MDGRGRKALAEAAVEGASSHIGTTNIWAGLKEALEVWAAGRATKSRSAGSILLLTERSPKRAQPAELQKYREAALSICFHKGCIR